MAKKIFFITIICLGFFSLAQNSWATTFVDENWDTGNPPAAWPCKAGCGASFDGWYPHNTDNCSSPGGPTCGLSTNYANSGTKSFRMYRAANSTDVCDLGYDLTSDPTTLYIRGYYYFPSADWSNFAPGAASEANDTMVHFIFTNSAQSNTGFRINMRDGSNFHLSGGEPAHYMGFLGQVDDQELWTDDGRTVMADPTNGYNILSHLDQWLCVEFKMQIAGGHSYLNQYVNGNLIASSDYAGTSQNNFNLMIQSGYTNMTSSWGTHSANFYLDDLKLSDSGPIGCGSGGGGGDTTPPAAPSGLSVS